LSVIKKLWKNDYFKTAIAIALVVAIVLGFFFGMQLILGTAVPIRVVESGSMCVQAGGCDGWSHPFDQSLHVGDIIIIQEVNPADLNTNYPNSDIIVYENPQLNGNLLATPIVHRIVEKEEINGTLYFQTKGDGNAQKWPAIPSVEQFDSHTLWYTGEGVPQNLVLGKVVMRIPWFGWITIFMRGNSWALPAVIGLVLLLVVIEFILPALRKKKRVAQQNKMHVQS
jgi:signal peptidase I